MVCGNCFKQVNRVYMPVIFLEVAGLFLPEDNMRLWKVDHRRKGRGPFLPRYFRRSTLQHWRRELRAGRRVPVGAAELAHGRQWDPC